MTILGWEAPQYTWDFTLLPQPGENQYNHALVTLYDNLSGPSGTDLDLYAHGITAYLEIQNHVFTLNGDGTPEYVGDVLTGHPSGGELDEEREDGLAVVVRRALNAALRSAQLQQRVDVPGRLEPITDGIIGLDWGSIFPEKGTKTTLDTGNAVATRQVLRKLYENGCEKGELNLLWEAYIQARIGHYGRKDELLGQMKNLMHLTRDGQSWYAEVGTVAGGETITVTLYPSKS